MVAEAQGSGVSEATAVQYAQVSAASGLLEHPHAGHCYPPRPTLAVMQVPFPRSGWDDSSGLLALTMYASAEARAGLEGRMLQAAPSNYLAHAAAGGLLR